MTAADKWKDCACVTSLFVTVASLYYAYKVKTTTLTALSPPKDGVEDLIGNTPMVRIKSLSDYTGLNVFAKMELNNPGGSAKDRVALNIIKTISSQEDIKGSSDKKNRIFEGTSGSTGISLAICCNALGYSCHISLPDDTSQEKLSLLTALGAIVNKVKPASIVDPNQYVNAAKSCSEEYTEGVGVFADQFENEANWKCHYETTGPEIYLQLNGEVDAFITGCGTGGTMAGVSRYLKEKRGDKVHIVLADPQGSGFYNRIKYGVMYDKVEKEGTRRRHQVDTLVEGIGLNRITNNFLKAENYIDDSIRITDEEAIKMAKFLCVNDGLFVGASTAINAVAVLKYAENLPKGSNVCIIACDSGSRHLSKFWKEALQVSNDLSISDII
ncbi:hypothetical protein KDRO_C00740 [Kluyveromyces lactis]|nr:hypothetical protein KDRO_C00740 [Kluyveromyces lactis]